MKNELAILMSDASSTAAGLYAVFSVLLILETE